MHRGASVAKVSRDRLMVAMDDTTRLRFPPSTRVGTPAHGAALAELGPCPQHQQSFNVRRMARAGLGEAAGDSPGAARDGQGVRDKMEPTIDDRDR